MTILTGEVLAWLSGARCRLAYAPADATATHCLLLQSNPDWFLPFWYWLTRVVPDKEPLNVCVCVYMTIYVSRDIQMVLEGFDCLHTLANGLQAVHSDRGETNTVLNSVTCTVSIP